MIGFKKIPKKSVFTVFVVAVISILLVYVDTQYNDPLPIEEVSFSEELNNNPEPIQNKQIHVVQRGESLSVIFDDKEVPLNTAYKIFNFDKKLMKSEKLKKTTKMNGNLVQIAYL